MDKKDKAIEKVFDLLSYMHTNGHECMIEGAKGDGVGCMACIAQCVLGEVRISSDAILGSTGDGSVEEGGSKNLEGLVPCYRCNSEMVFGGLYDDITEDEIERQGIYVVCTNDECFMSYGENWDRDAMPDHFFHSKDEARKHWNCGR